MDMIDNSKSTAYFQARYCDTLESLQLSAHDVVEIKHVTPGDRRILITTRTRETAIRAYDLDRQDKQHHPACYCTQCRALRSR